MTFLFTNDIALSKGRHDILVDGKWNRFGGECCPKFSCSVALTYSSVDWLLEFKRSAIRLS